MESKNKGKEKMASVRVFYTPVPVESARVGAYWYQYPIRHHNPHQMGRQSEDQIPQHRGDGDEFRESRWLHCLHL